MASFVGPAAQEGFGYMIDRELLWKAWPDGYLAMRGMLTVGGWHCVARREHESLWTLLRSEGGMTTVYGLPCGGPPYERRSCWRPEMDDFRLCAELGDLLPQVDPQVDPATWACCKLDLARAAGVAPGPRLASLGRIPTEISWIRDDGGWWLSALTWRGRDQEPATVLPGVFLGGDGGGTWTLARENIRFRDLGTDDPALALVLARINACSRFAQSTAG